MATSGIINGTLLRIYKGGTAIAYATNCTLSITRELRETLTKDSPGTGWRTVTVGQKSATMTTESLYSDAGDSSTNIQPGDLFTDLDNGTPLIMRFTTDVAGDTYYETTGYCTNIEMNAPVEENSTFSATFELSGALTKGTES